MEKGTATDASGHCPRSNVNIASCGTKKEGGVNYSGERKRNENKKIERERERTNGRRKSSCARHQLAVSHFEGVKAKHCVE